MRILSIAIGLGLTACALPAVPPPSPGLEPDARTEQELRSLRASLQAALRQGDRAALEEILGEGFTFIHSTGTVESRAGYIDRMVAAAGGPTVELDFSDERIRVYGGHTAIWTTRSTRRSNAGAPPLSFRGTDVLVRVDGQWKWVSVHSTRVPDPSR